MSKQMKTLRNGSIGWLIISVPYILLIAPHTPWYAGFFVGAGSYLLGIYVGNKLGKS
jgi:hypothetical protein